MSALYFARAPRSSRKSWSCARGISRGAPGSNPPLLTVPLQGPPDAVAQANRRVVTQLAPGPRDVEGPALSEEVYTAPVDWRRKAKRREDRLARGARQPERPDRQSDCRRRHARDLRRHVHQLPQRRHFPAAQDVRSSGRGRNAAAQAESLAQVVDVGDVVVV